MKNVYQSLLHEVRVVNPTEERSIQIKFKDEPRFRGQNNQRKAWSIT